MKIEEMKGESGKNAYTTVPRRTIQKPGPGRFGYFYQKDVTGEQ